MRDTNSSRQRPGSSRQDIERRPWSTPRVRHRRRHTPERQRQGSARQKARSKGLVGTEPDLDRVRPGSTLARGSVRRDAQPGKASGSGSSSKCGNKFLECGATAQEALSCALLHVRAASQGLMRQCSLPSALRQGPQIGMPGVGMSGPLNPRNSRTEARMRSRELSPAGATPASGAGSQHSPLPNQMMRSTSSSSSSSAASKRPSPPLKRAPSPILKKPGFPQGIPSSAPPPWGTTCLADAPIGRQSLRPSPSRRQSSPASETPGAAQHHSRRSPSFSSPNLGARRMEHPHTPLPPTAMDTDAPFTTAAEPASSAGSRGRRIVSSPIPRSPEVYQPGPSSGRWKDSPIPRSPAVEQRTTNPGRRRFSSPMPQPQTPADARPSSLPRRVSSPSPRALQPHPTAGATGGEGRGWDRDRGGDSRVWESRGRERRGGGEQGLEAVMETRVQSGSRGRIRSGSLNDRGELGRQSQPLGPMQRNAGDRGLRTNAPKSRSQPFPLAPGPSTRVGQPPPLADAKPASCSRSLEPGEHGRSGSKGVGVPCSRNVPVEGRSPLPVDVEQLRRWGERVREGTREKAGGTGGGGKSGNSGALQQRAGRGSASGDNASRVRSVSPGARDWFRVLDQDALAPGVLASPRAQRPGHDAREAWWSLESWTRLGGVSTTQQRTSIHDSPQPPAQPPARRFWSLEVGSRNVGSPGGDDKWDRLRARASTGTGAGTGTWLQVRGQGVGNRRNRSFRAAHRGCASMTEEELEGLGATDGCYYARKGERAGPGTLMLFARTHSLGGEPPASSPMLASAPSSRAGAGAGAGAVVASTLGSLFLPRMESAPRAGTGPTSGILGALRSWAASNSNSSRSGTNDTRSPKPGTSGGRVGMEAASRPPSSTSEAASAAAAAAVAAAHVCYGPRCCSHCSQAAVVSGTDFGELDLAAGYGAMTTAQEFSELWCRESEVLARKTGGTQRNEQSGGTGEEKQCCQCGDVLQACGCSQMRPRGSLEKLWLSRQQSCPGKRPEQLEGESRGVLTWQHRGHGENELKQEEEVEEGEEGEEEEGDVEVQVSQEHRWRTMHAQRWERKKMRSDLERQLELLRQHKQEEHQEEQRRLQTKQHNPRQHKQQRRKEQQISGQRQLSVHKEQHKNPQQRQHKFVQRKQQEIEQEQERQEHQEQFLGAAWQEAGAKSFSVKERQHLHPPDSLRMGRASFLGHMSPMHEEPTFGSTFLGVTSVPCSPPGLPQQQQHQQMKEEVEEWRGSGMLALEHKSGGRTEEERRRALVQEIEEAEAEMATEWAAQEQWKAVSGVGARSVKDVREGEKGGQTKEGQGMENRPLQGQKMKVAKHRQEQREGQVKGQVEGQLPTKLQDNQLQKQAHMEQLKGLLHSQWEQLSGTNHQKSGSIKSNSTSRSQFLQVYYGVRTEEPGKQKQQQQLGRQQHQLRWKLQEGTPRGTQPGASGERKETPGLPPKAAQSTSSAKETTEHKGSDHSGGFGYSSDDGESVGMNSPWLKDLRDPISESYYTRASPRHPQSRDVHEDLQQSPRTTSLPHTRTRPGQGSQPMHLSTHKSFRSREFRKNERK